MTGSGFGSSSSVFVSSCPSCPRCVGSRASPVLPGSVSFPTRVTLQSPPDLFQTIELPSLSPSNAIVSVVCLLVHALPGSCFLLPVSCFVLSGRIPALAFSSPLSYLSPSSFLFPLSSSPLSLTRPLDPRHKHNNASLESICMIMK